MKKILILGAAGFLGQHLEYRLKAEGHFVVSVARAQPKYRKSVADEFNILDLANPPDFHYHWYRHDFDEAYQLAGDVGGVGHIAVGDHDADILSGSLKITLNTLDAMRKVDSHARIFFASSQCVYPDIGFDPYVDERISDPPAPFKETDASFNTFPFAQEKLYAEALYDAYRRNYGFSIRIGRLGNTYGPYCTWNGLRSKVVGGICGKVAEVQHAGSVDIWGNGQQIRSFTYVDDAIEGMIRLMASDYSGPVNIASDEAVTVEQLFETICRVAGKIVAPQFDLSQPTGVRYRNSDNTRCKYWLDWEPSTSLGEGLRKTYPWIAEQVKKALASAEGFV